MEIEGSGTDLNALCWFLGDPLGCTSTIVVLVTHLESSGYWDYLVNKSIFTITISLKWSW